jgi:hypothetical protein
MVGPHSAVGQLAEPLQELGLAGRCEHGTAPATIEPSGLPGNFGTARQQLDDLGVKLVQSLPEI